MLGLKSLLDIRDVLDISDTKYPVYTYESGVWGKKYKCEVVGILMVFNAMRQDEISKKLSHL